MTDDDYPYRSPPDAKAWQPEWPPVSTPAAELTSGEPPAAEASLAPTSAPSLTMIIFVALVLCVPGNVLIVPVSEGPTPPSPWTLFVTAIGGSIGAQAALLAVLVVWGAGPLWRRLVWHWGLAAVLLLAWCAGWMWTYGHMIYQPRGHRYELTEARVFACGILLFALLVQAVPWLLRIYLGWRIQLPATRSDSAVERLSIRDLLVGTVLAAIAVAAARAGRPEDTTNGDYWLGWLGVGGGVGVFVVVAVVPMVYFTLGMRNANWGIVCVATLSTIVATCFTTLLLATRPSGGPTVWWIPLAMIALVGGYSGGLAGTLWIARAYGYRLVMGRTDH
jgi:hypothetical protein